MVYYVFNSYGKKIGKALAIGNDDYVAFRQKDKLIAIAWNSLYKYGYSVRLAKEVF